MIKIALGFRQVIAEERRAGLHTVHEEGADEEDGRAAAGNAERQSRDDGAGDAGVVRGVGCDKALIVAGAELIGLLGHGARHAIAREGGDGGTRSGDHADDEADDRRDQHGLLIAERRAEALKLALHVGGVRRCAGADGFLEDQGVQLADAEQTKQQRDLRYAAVKLCHAEGAARDAEEVVQTDRADQKAEDRGQQAAGDGAAVREATAVIPNRASMNISGGPKLSA